MAAFISIRFFGPARDLAGKTDDRLEVSANETLGAVAGRIAGQYPRLADIPGMRLALNQSFVALSTHVRDGDEVAVIPPVSGG